MIREWLIRVNISTALQRVLKGPGIGSEQAEDFVHEDLCAVMRANVGMLPFGWRSIPWPAVVVREFVAVERFGRTGEMDCKDFEALPANTRPDVIGYGRYIRLPIYIPSPEP